MIIITAAIAIILLAVPFCRNILIPQIAHILIINSSMDLKNSVLENNAYTLVLHENSQEKSVEIDVREKQSGEVVFSIPYSIRSWDLKSIIIEENNNIVIESGDIGRIEYLFSTDDHFWTLKTGDCSLS